MGKTDLITRVAETAGISRGRAASVVETVIQSCTKSHQRGKLGYITLKFSPGASNYVVASSKPLKTTSKPVKIKGPYATPYDTGAALGLSRSRVETVVKHAKGLPMDFVGFAAKKQKRTSGTDAKNKKPSKSSKPSN
jgi:hypothetical protein